MIFCYTLMYEELILMITLSSLMLVICVLSFFLDYSLGVYQFHKYCQEQVFTYINFLECVSSYFIDFFPPLFVIFSNYFGFNLSYFSSFSRSKGISLMFFNIRFIRQAFKTTSFLLRTAIATLHKFEHVMLSSNFSTNVF